LADRLYSNNWRKPVEELGNAYFKARVIKAGLAGSLCAFSAQAYTEKKTSREEAQYQDTPKESACAQPAGFFCPQA
jgi:hypothetical protein